MSGSNRNNNELFYTKIFSFIQNYTVFFNVLKVIDYFPITSRGDCLWLTFSLEF